MGIGLGLNANEDGIIASWSGETGSSLVLSLHRRSPSRCTFCQPSVKRKGDGRGLTEYSGFDRTSDRIWDSMNKGVSLALETRGWG